jgi:hypothetical protein
MAICGLKTHKAPLVNANAFLNDAFGARTVICAARIAVAFLIFQ